MELDLFFLFAIVLILFGGCVAPKEKSAVPAAPIEEKLNYPVYWVARLICKQVNF